MCCRQEVIGVRGRWWRRQGIFNGYGGSDGGWDGEGDEDGDEEASSSTLPPPPRSDFFTPILTHLGFQQLATAVPSLSVTSTWTGPFTIFAPSDASIHTCPSCSLPRLLQEHIVPGVFSLNYLRTLAFGTKIETIVPGRCVTVTSALNNSKIFVGGVEITRPDLFDNGLLIVHGLDGFVSHLSPLSCNIERMTSLSFPQAQSTDRIRSPSGVVRHAP
ncbi:hypothetical protein L1049_006069 [Liquidambar formosana]|uniref:FAS1 domain-containing protein n=1 Tax=Liquidambar formosana TaxID=63359 RepID=A0AAP0WTP5_LIQFO